MVDNTKNINIIVCVSENNVIGLNGSLPWNITLDKNYFLNKINNGIIIEGSRSFLKRQKPLPNTYKTIVLSKDKTKIINNDFIENNLYDAIQLAKSLDFNRQIWICGGENIYKEAIELSDRLYITNIHKNFSGDRFFVNNWDAYFKNNIYSSPIYNENGISLIFEIYEK